MCIKLIKAIDKYTTSMGEISRLTNSIVIYFSPPLWVYQLGTFKIYHTTICLEDYLYVSIFLEVVMQLELEVLELMEV